MPLNTEKVGKLIASLRKHLNMTQNELGERLNVSFQAVSKWERGETIPDAALLPELADALDTTIDNILRAGQKALSFKGKLTAKDARDGLFCLLNMGEKLGQQHLFYRAAIEGISTRINSDIEPMLTDAFYRECLIAEAIISNMTAGYGYDLAEVKSVFMHSKWYDIVCEYAEKYGIR